MHCVARSGLADASERNLSCFASNDAGADMTDFVEPDLHQKTAALKRDFDNREFSADFSQSVQQLAAFVSNFGECSFPCADVFGEGY